MGTSQPLPYDQADPDDIERYAQRLIGHSLREMLPDAETITAQTGKGRFGDILEKEYFGIDGGNRPTPDFEEANVELKATPMKRQSKKRYVAKERLVLGMIDYMKVAEESWQTSSFLRKNALILLIHYLWEEDVLDIDYVIKIARLWEFPEEDIEVIRDDWETIVAKIREGKAHELSEGDTNYLAACTKGAKGTDRRRQPHSTTPAKPRAFSLKQSYMNTVIEAGLADKIESFASAEELKAGKTLEDIVHERFRPHIGLTADEIAARLDVKAKRGAKNFYAVLTQHILGVAADKKIAEFEKADITVKTMRLKPSGKPKEDISFPAFQYMDLVQQDWEDSDLRIDLTKRFLFAIYQLDRDDIPTLVRTQFWTMPISDVDTYGRTCFEQTIDRIMEDKAEYLPKKSENRACHVRPHGRDSTDTLPTPTGRYVVRKSFWLNGSYIAEQLAGEKDT
ncbi:MAG: Sau3AI family type II restriction endonuclease [Actinomycetota bacterium]|nr:Sau3AI family type II restriction endonuclease [Actinomycetota bacterium]